MIAFQDQEELIIETDPSERLLEKCIEYFNRNLLLGHFSLIRRKEPYPLKCAKEWHKKYVEGDQVVAIGLIRHRVVGVAHLNRCEGDDFLPWKLSITVDAAYWGKGIGTRLIECIIRQAKQYGISDIRALPREDNVAAVGFLKKMGFKAISRESRIEESGEKVILNCMVLKTSNWGDQNCPRTAQTSNRFKITQAMRT
jgi:N-acetylglutamate synthase-like GNAT family acetyltransferase